MKEIYLIRHGETEYNKKGIMQGSGVDASLNEKGIWQADKFYKAYKEVPFKKVYTSALKRSQESVAQFVESGLPTEAFSELNEINWGRIDGKVVNYNTDPEVMELITSWKSGDYEAKIGEGESIADLNRKQKKAMDIILSRENENPILICMHGRAIRALLCLLTNQSLSHMESFKHNNLGLYKLQCKEGVCEIIESNNVDHLNE